MAFAKKYTKEERLKIGKKIKELKDEGVGWLNIGVQFHISHMLAKKIMMEYLSN